MNAFRKYWYVVAQSDDLRDAPLAAVVLGESFVVWRQHDGQPVAMADRCLHRLARLSSGRSSDGVLQCGYHGWCYDGSGRVCRVPSAGSDEGRRRPRCSPPFASCECDGYVYVRLDPESGALGDAAPLPMPHWNEPGWGHVRLVNRFAGNVADCIENFIDVPHTAFVHRGVFRDSRGERIQATVVRSAGRVHVRYRGEQSNLGPWTWFLNPRRTPVEHEDNYIRPNITCVRYRLGNGYGFVITSQAVPIDERNTLVYTDLAYRFGCFTRLAAPFVRRAGQKVIDQDLAILAEQGEVIAAHGRRFSVSPPDLIHRCVDDIRRAIARGDDPHGLPDKTFDIEFFV